MVKIFRFTWGSNRDPSVCEPSTLPLDKNPNTFKLGELAKMTENKSDQNLKVIKNKILSLTTSIRQE